MLQHGLRRAAQVGAGLLVGSFLIGYAAPFVPPAAFWWTNLFAVILPLLSVGVGLVALGLGVLGLVRRRWLYGVTAVVLMSLVGSRFGPSLGLERPSSSGPALRLMSFNVPGVHSEEGAPKALARILDRERPMVLALQESQVRTPASPDRPLSMSRSLRTVLQRDSTYRLPRSLPRRTIIQQPVLGRIRLDSLRVHPLPPDGATSARSRFTQTHFRWAGRRVVLFNLHLHTVGQRRPWAEPGAWADLSRWWSFLQTYRAGALHRAEQARRVRQAIEQTREPVLVTGDFNSTPHQWAYRHIAAGLQDAVAEHGGRWTATFPAHTPLVRIDHVLAGPAWRVVSAHVPPLAEHAAASDHRPVVAQLQWRTTPAE